MHRETGYRKVVPHLKGGLVSAVNYAEVLKKAVENGVDLLTARLLLQNLAFVVVPFDTLQATETARLWPLTRSKGLSFADRACLSLGILRNATVVTGDGEMRDVGLPLKVTMFR
jgi:PIN domain nuclease of toxin-antitoxin system